MEQQEELLKGIAKALVAIYKELHRIADSVTGQETPEQVSWG